MNNITIAGNVGKDIEVKNTSKSTVGNFSVADKQYGDKPAIWWRCSLWGDRVEKLAKYITKGASVTVSGSLSEESYKDSDGNEKKSFTLRVSEVALHGGSLSTKKQSSDDSDSDVPF